MADLRRHTILNQSNQSPLQSVPFSPAMTPRSTWSPAATVPDWSSSDKHQCSFDQNVPKTPRFTARTSGGSQQQMTPLLASTPPDQLVPSTPVEHLTDLNSKLASKSRQNRTIMSSPTTELSHDQLNLFDGDDDDIFPT
ncbi:uncharacterized protein LOC117122132 [Anneissia japonica]|uniref:uncharacterized protein LOC117122132 n=1 Tax=Anneissia japonica TaxID=1529436 RepID=UPI0014257E8C|nr:uncharacterized protein LOC117122132 [Anneissia japonica]